MRNSDKQIIKDWDILTSKQVDAFLQESESGGSFTTLVMIFGSAPFHRLFSLSRHRPEFKLLLSFVDRFTTACESATDSEDRALARAIIAQLAKELERVDHAEEQYRKAIVLYKQLEAQNVIPYRPGGNINQLYVHGLVRSQIALARIYCQLGRLEAAEELYRQLMLPYYQQNWFALYRINKSIHAMQDGNDGNAFATLACELGEAYEKVGRNNLAAKKYEDFREFIHYVLHPNPNPPDLIRIRCSLTEYRIIVPSPNATYDAIIGLYPAMDELMEMYLSFDSRHFSIWRRKDVAIMTVKMEALKAE